MLFLMPSQFISFLGLSVLFFYQTFCMEFGSKLYAQIDIPLKLRFSFKRELSFFLEELSIKIDSTIKNRKNILYKLKNEYLKSDCSQLSLTSMNARFTRLTQVPQA